MNRLMVHCRRTLLIALVALFALPAAAQAREPYVILTGDAGWLTPRENVAYELDASHSFDRDENDLVLFEWDLDGDGGYETNTGSSPYVTHTWTNRAGLYDAHATMNLRVTDAAGEWSALNVPLQVTDALNGWFTYSPQLVNPGDPVALTAHTAPELDPEEQPPPMTYDWDLDGDGVYEHATGTTPSATYIAPEVPMLRTIGLRVSDNGGNVSFVRRRIEVLPRHSSRDMATTTFIPTNLGAQPGVMPTPTSGASPVVTPENVLKLVPVNKGATVMGPRVIAIAGNINGIAIRLSGEAGTRYHIRVVLKASQARKTGLGRKLIVFARGTVRIRRNGTGYVRMRWRKSLYRAFRKVPRNIITVQTKPY